MKDKTLLRLKKMMERSAKTVDAGDKAIVAIKKAQDKVVEEFAQTVQDTVKKSKEEIAYHNTIIAEAEGMTL